MGGCCRCCRPYHEDFSPGPLNVDLKFIQEKRAFDVRHELALVADEIYDALNEIIATLGFNVYPVLFQMVISELNVLAAIIVYFLGPLVMSLDVLVALPPFYCEQSFDCWWLVGP